MNFNTSYYVMQYVQICSIEFKTCTSYRYILESTKQNQYFSIYSKSENKVVTYLLIINKLSELLIYEYYKYRTLTYEYTNSKYNLYKHSLTEN